MPNKRARERQLAKLAARRQAERTQAKRRRSRTVAVVVVAAAVGLVVLGRLVVSGGDTGATPSTSPSASASASERPGTQTGTVQPGTAAEAVACGASKPAAADEPKPQFNAPTKVVPDGATVTVTLVTSCGDIVVELDPATAPQTVNSFVFLAKKDYFDGTFFHRLDTSIDVIQGGDPEGASPGETSGGPGYAIPDELQGGETYGPGTLAMANRGPGTGGSQFFIITGPEGHNLDGNPAYTVFGTVTAGLDVAKRIQRIPIVDPEAAAAGDLSGQAPTQAIYIEDVVVQIVRPSASASTSPTPAS
jgi:peptidyl-prolyl cis-trans isomerase B (cyclophilin B)